MSRETIIEDFIAKQTERNGNKSEQNRVLLSATDLYKTFYKGDVAIPVLKGVDFHVKQGEFLSIIGQSGSGKSTLLHLLATLDAPDAGEIYFEDHRIDTLNQKGKDVLRNRYFGMIFQFYHLLPELTTLENVLSPIMIRFGMWSYLRHRSQYRKRALEILEMVGLSHRIKHKPKELSGGEMQRASIARALIADPTLIFADEPTGNLDQETGEDIMNMLKQLNRERQLTIVMVTHDSQIADQADRIVRLKSGLVETVNDYCVPAA